MGQAPNPPDLENLFRVGYDRLYGGDCEGAARAFAAAVAVDPANAEAWAAVAGALGDRPADGPGPVVPTPPATAWSRATAVEPGRWSWRLELADSLRRAGDFSTARAAFAALVAERSDAAVARLGLARTLSALGHPDEALDEFREAAALRPDDRQAALELADALVGNGDALAAVELLQPLARRFEDDPALHHAVGRAWVALREPEKALTALRRARGLLEGRRGDQDGNRGGADAADAFGIERLIAALEAGEGADLSAAYVRALFDRYADRFDEDLVEKLAYAGPELLREAVDRTSLPARAGDLRILDLGCGTGLAGVVFRPLAAHLAGVDLSPRMVEKARRRALYDALEVGDVVEAMDRAPAAWDLLVAADVLVYLGDLAPVFAAAARALVPGGRFAATIEALPDGSSDAFALGPTRRYAHGGGHVRAAAEIAGFTVSLLEPCTTRREKGVPVPGIRFVVER